jgi:predicted naringenin-chalcone synthase
MQTDLTHLIVVSCTGFFAPGLDYEIIRRLGLRSNIKRFCLGFMGCHGGFNGLQLACALVEADSSARVLLCTTELCSLHFQYSVDPGQITANALFGDGAGAAIIGAGAEPAPAVRSVGSYLIDSSNNEMSWVIGDQGFKMHLSARVPGVIRRVLRTWLEPWLAEQGLRLPDVAAWAIHPGGPRILSAVSQSLGLHEGALASSLVILREHGNMSSATIWFILERLRNAGIVGPCVMLGFGPGLIAEVAVVEF